MVSAIFNHVLYPPGRRAGVNGLLKHLKCSPYTLGYS